MSAIATSTTDTSNENAKTCNPCRNVFSEPNIDDEAMVTTPPIINTLQSTFGSREALCSNRVRRCSVSSVSSLSAWSSAVL